MRKRFFLMLCLQSLLFLCFFSKVNAQVLNGNITINTQAQIDAFNYTSVTGNVNIIELTPGAIQNLDGLSELTLIGGFLQIENTTTLTNINGLSNLTSIGSDPPAPPVTGFLAIEKNRALTNVDGLSSLTYIGGPFFLMDNNALTNLDGLSNLTEIDHGLNFQRNQALTNIDGLFQITSLGQVGFLILIGNPALTNIDGLSNITAVIGALEISNNPSLTNINGLSKVAVVFQDLIIKDNSSLANIDGLVKVPGVGGDLIIENNDALTNVDGLSNLKLVAGRFEIIGNASLTNLDGLSNLTSVDGIFAILFNPLLTNLDGLSKLETVEGHLTITANIALTNIDGLSSLTSVGGNLGMAGNNALTNLNGFSNLIYVGLDLGISNNPALTDFCGLYKLFNTGTIVRNIRIKNNGANTVFITAPEAIIVNADPGVCSAIISTAVIGSATIDGCLVPFQTEHSEFPAGNVFPVGITQITWLVTDGAGNTATTTQLITVVDNQNPVITCPGGITVSCASDVPAVDINSVTATDNCSAIVTHVSDVISNQTCANRFTLTRTYMAIDPAGNSVTCAQVITVNDNIPPEIAGLSVSQTALWPPNHKMHDITLSYTATDNCVGNPLITVTVESNEPVNGTGDGDTSPDWEVIDDHHIRLRAERAANGNGRIYTITVTVDDGCNPPVSQTTQVYVAHNITAPQSGKPFKVGSTVSFNGVFQDKPGNTHSAKWLLDGSAVTSGTVSEPAGNQNGKVTGAYRFKSAGVYKLQMNITDQTGVTSYANTNGDVDAIVVIYDPNGGYVYGGGYFDSPAGSLISNASATGKASYGFTVNYFKNSTFPKGETQFEFKVGEFEFNALNFDYLVINNAMAQIKGTGKIIGGQSGIGFTMTVVDGELDGSGVDKIRMKIYNKNNGTIIYDNQPGASDAGLPVAAVGTNSVIVIQGNSGNAPTTKAGEEVVREENLNGLHVAAHPNPSRGNFTLVVKSNNAKEKISLQAFDQYGRSIETRENIISESAIRFGDLYRPGAYYVRVVQGKEHKEMKLIKLSE